MKYASDAPMSFRSKLNCHLLYPLSLKDIFLDGPRAVPLASSYRLWADPVRDNTIA